MSNMSYCRFQNTLRDLRDCYDALTEGADENRDPVSDDDDENALEGDEAKARDSLIVLCRKIVDEFGAES